VPYEQIELLDDETIYTIIDLPSSRRYRALPDMFTQDHLNIYQLIRRGLHIEPNTEGKRKVYLKRDSSPKIDIGILRIIDNEQELIELLQSNGFEIITLGTKSITEKSNLLNDIDILISPWGANLMNLIFANSPKQLFVFGNNRSFGIDYFWHISQALNNTKINYQSKLYPCTDNHLDVTNHSNASFKVDLNDFKKFV
jgi:capsular polysaccharide biosynthesis protein